jgi:hypothetical protein
MEEGGITAQAAPRMLGTFTTLKELQVLARARAEELALSRDTINKIAGFADGHANKLLSPQPAKKIGERSLPLLLGALALKLVVIDDPQQREQIFQRYTPRNPRLCAHAAAPIAFTLSRRFMRAIGKKGGLGRKKKLSAKRLTQIARAAGKRSRATMTARRASELARRAALIRWRDVKVAARNPGREGRGPSRPPKGKGWHRPPAVCQ